MPRRNPPPARPLAESAAPTPAPEAVAERVARLGWLLLIYRVPSEPSNNRVSVWRELKRLGALYLQQCVCIVPALPACDAGIRSALTRIEAMGGSSNLFRLPPGAAADEPRLIHAFRQLSAKEYAEITEECRTKFVKEIEFERFRKNYTYEEAEEIRALAAPAERVGAGQPKGPQRLRHPAGPALWAALRAGWPRVRSGPPVLVHRDYHPSNTVWLRGRLAGVVDWDDAARGPPGYDLAMCRVELALLSGPGAAAAFLPAYEAAAGRPAADVAFWDLYRAWWTLPDPERWLPGLHRLGRTDLTAALLRARLDAFIGDALARAT